MWIHADDAYDMAIDEMVNNHKIKNDFEPEVFPLYSNKDYMTNKHIENAIAYRTRHNRKDIITSLIEEKDKRSYIDTIMAVI